MSSTPNQRAAYFAAEWCARNPGWRRICDMTPEETDLVCNGFDDLPADQKQYWLETCDTEEAARTEYNTYYRKGYKKPAGFVMDSGKFVSLDVWRSMDLRSRGFMMVFKVYG